MSKIKIVPFAKQDDSKKLESGENVVNSLEEALEAAKDGNIVTCVIVMIDHDGDIISGWANEEMTCTMLGALELTKQEYMMNVFEQRSE
jgi:hypothetical protein